MPVFDYNPDDEHFVGLRDEIGQIVQWPTHDAFGEPLKSHDFLQTIHLDDTHFVVAKETQIKPDMEFKLIERTYPAVTFDTNFEPNDEGSVVPVTGGDAEAPEATGDVPPIEGEASVEPVQDEASADDSPAPTPKKRK